LSPISTGNSPNLRGRALPTGHSIHCLTTHLGEAQPRVCGLCTLSSEAGYSGSSPETNATSKRSLRVRFMSAMAFNRRCAAPGGIASSRGGSHNQSWGRFVHDCPDGWKQSSREAFAGSGEVELQTGGAVVEILVSIIQLIMALTLAKG
jgi:hypothetical protein